MAETPTMEEPQSLAGSWKSRPASGHSQTSSSSGVTWLLNVLESGHTLPPLEGLLSSSAAAFKLKRNSISSNASSISEAEIFHKWTRELESLAATPSVAVTGPRGVTAADGSDSFLLP